LSPDVVLYFWMSGSGHSKGFWCLTREDDGTLIILKYQELHPSTQIYSSIVLRTSDPTELIYVCTCIVSF